MRNKFLGRSLRLITLVAAIVVLSCAMSSTRLYAHVIAPTLGLPDIGWDSAPAGPTGGETTFNVGTLGLSMTGDIVNYIGPPLAPFLGGAVTGDTFSLTTTLLPASVSVNGGLLHADFSGGTLTVMDAVSALALSGTVTDMAIQGFIGTSVGLGGFLFTPTGGYLAGAFGPGGGAVFAEFNLSPNNWAAGTYGADWTAETKGDTSPVPEPGTIALLGTGLLGMVGYGRMRVNSLRRKKATK
ncbi:MAG: PEP-CTERM sorting domain-containing protein [Candidatus Brocadiales bacterium]